MGGHEGQKPEGLKREESPSCLSPPGDERPGATCGAKEEERGAPPAPI